MTEFTTKSLTMYHVLGLIYFKYTPLVLTSNFTNIHFSTSQFRKCFDPEIIFVETAITQKIRMYRTFFPHGVTAP